MEIKTFSVKDSLSDSSKEFSTSDVKRRVKALETPNKIGGYLAIIMKDYSELDDLASKEKVYNRQFNIDVNALFLSIDKTDLSLDNLLSNPVLVKLFPAVTGIRMENPFTYDRTSAKYRKLIAELIISLWNTII